MPSKKPSKKSPSKKVGKTKNKELSDKDLEDVAGGAITDPATGDDAVLRKRPGRVKSLHQTP